MSQPIIVEYVWCSGKNTHHDLRSKCQTRYVANRDQYIKDPKSLVSQLSIWNFDGSSTGQAKGQDTEILIKPVATFSHPFMKDVPSFVALAECFFPNGEPTPDNTRCMAREVFEAAAAKGQDPWFGLEQEYVLMKNSRPLGWPNMGEPSPQGPYYCGTGALAVFGRELAVQHYQLCVNMGLKISGVNGEVMPGQWEYQVGPCHDIEAGDHVLLSRWVYLRLTECMETDVNFESKPQRGDWNGSGMHTNFSTAAMRADGGIKVISEAIERMGSTFFKDVQLYGADNNERLSGKHETSKLDEFNAGVGTRHTSCRIPNQCKKDGKGYFEDRRPSSSADPYLVTARLFASACAIDSPLMDAFGAANEPTWLADLKERSASRGNTPK